MSDLEDIVVRLMRPSRSDEPSAAFDLERAEAALEIKRLRAALRDALKLYAQTDDAAPWRMNKWSELKEALREDE